jgi:reversibly glycosylated polypeptide / UDP-arabinopyranose mutase
MAVQIEDSEIDIVIAVLHPNLSPFLEAWGPFFSHFHIIVVKDPDLDSELQISSGFDLKVYTKSDMAAVAKSTSINFSGHSCRYFGYLVSRKKYVICIDQDCLPDKDPSGLVTDAVAQHITNLATPAHLFSSTLCTIHFAQEQTLSVGTHSACVVAFLVCCRVAFG